jgi:hypothetical protein
MKINFTQRLFLALASCFALNGAIQAQTYCEPPGSGQHCGTEYYNYSLITSGGINSINGCNPGYQAGQVNTGAPGQTVYFNIVAWYGTLKIWVDWNQDLDFDDVGEEVFDNGGPDFGTNGAFVIPATASLGTTRMRLRYTNEEYFSIPMSPCNYQDYSEHEDYDFVVSNSEYCAPVANSASCDEGKYISDFFVYGPGPTNIANSPSGCNDGYVSGQSQTVARGDMVGFTITGSDYGQHKIWVDWNADNDFEDVGEEVHSTGSVAYSSDMFVVPMDAQLGTTRLRVRYRANDGNMFPFTACNTMSTGEYEDYDFNITEYIEECDATPAAGSISVTGDTAYCDASTAVLTLSGNTSINNITLLWQKSTDGGQIWSGIPGATTSVYNTTGQTATTMYRALVLCSNSGSYSYSSPVTITVNPTVTPTLALSAPASICYLQGNATFSAPGTNLCTDAVYTWYRNGIEIEDATGSEYITGNISKYADEKIAVTVTGITTACATATELSDTVTVRALGTLDPNTTYITASGATKLCEGDEVTFTSKSAASPGASFSWARDGAAIDGENGASYTTSYPGVITATVTSAAGCTRSASRTINPLPTAIAVVQGFGEAAFCTGSFITLEAAPVSGATYRWKQDGTNRGALVTQKAQTGGNYTVTVTKSSCTATSLPVEVSEKTTVATVTNYSGSNTICTTPFGGGMLGAVPDARYTYQWYRGNTPLAGQVNAFLMVSSSGSYKVAVQNGSCAVKKSNSIAITAVPAPTPVVSVTSMTPEHWTLHAEPSGADNYQWFDGNFEPIPGATSQNYDATANGMYYMLLTKNGCPGGSAPFMVNSETFETPGARVIASIEETAVISIFPNPSTGIFNIGSEQPVNVVVKDVQGRIVMDIRNASSIDLSNHAAGMYVLSITNAEGKLLQVERVVKQ